MNAIIEKDADQVAQDFVEESRIKQFKVATPSEKLMRHYIKKGTYKFDGDELHKRCTRCREYWPADTEFFYANKHTDGSGDGLHTFCKACYMENRYPSGRQEKVDAK